MSSRLSTTAVVIALVFLALFTPAPAQAQVCGERDDGPRGERTTTADGTGRFVLCSVPAGRPVSAWVETLGGVTRAETDFVVVRDAIARLDLAMELGRVAPVRIVGSEAPGFAGRALVSGRVLDATTETPVAATLVVLSDEHRALTDRQGRFRIEDVPPGGHVLEVRGLGYALEPQALELPDAAAVELELRVSPQALALAPLVVRMFSPEERTIRATPHAQRVLAGERIRFAEIRGVSVHDLLRELPGVRVSDPAWYRIRPRAPEVYGPCIQTSRPAIAELDPAQSAGGVVTCRMVEVFVDGVSVVQAPEFLMNLPLTDLESVESLHPLQAGRWGYEAGLYGALLLWTRGRGPHAGPERNRP